MVTRAAAGLWAGCVLAAFVALPTTQAQAYDVVQSKVVSDNPADWTPNVVGDGEVRYLAQAGNTMVAGGDFTQVQNHGSSTTLTRRNIFSFDASTGVVSPSFAPSLDGLVRVLVASSDGRNVFVGGEFHSVSGVAQVGLAELSLSNGAIVSAFRPALDGRVYSMKLVGGKLYIAGSFTHVNGRSIARLARLDPTSGAVDTAFSTSFTGTNNPTNPGIPLIEKMDISPDAHRLVAVGNFTEVNGLDRPQIAMLNITGSTPTVVDWQTNRFRAPCTDGYQTYMHDIEFSPDGAYFVVVTTGGSYTGTNQGVGCDSATRWETNATGSALQPTWIDFTGNDTLWSVAITGTAVYTGGHNRWMNNAYGNDEAGPGAVPRPGLSALDPLTGVPFNWNPTRTTGIGVFDLLATDTGLWIGDDTDYVGHEYHYKLAFFPLTGGTSVPNVSTGSLPGDVYQLGSGSVVSGSVGTCGQKTGTDSHDTVTRRRVDPARNPLTTPGVQVPTSGMAWSRVRGAFMLSGTLYTGWPNGQLCTATFNGSAFGPPKAIDLHGNKFIGDLADVTGMFFANDRIYFTRSGKQVLYYRALVPESNIVGAVAYLASANVSGVDFSQVGGMFLDGSRLYYVTRNDGALSRVSWNGNAPVGGTSVKVSGPSIDGVDWRSAGLFLYTGQSAPPPAAVSFVGESHVVANASQWSVQVPTSVVAGDALVIALSTSSTSPSSPSGSGWTLIDTRTAASLTSKAWRKVATGADAGATVTITAPGIAKSSVDLLAYRGTAANPISAFADRAETISRTTHTTPTVTVPAAGGWVLSVWAEKSSSTTRLSPPSGVTQRYGECGTLGGHTCLLVSDSGGLVSGGAAAGGLTATADSAGYADTMWTLILAPA